MINNSMNMNKNLLSKTIDHKKTKTCVVVNSGPGRDRHKNVAWATG